MNKEYFQKNKNSWACAISPWYGWNARISYDVGGIAANIARNTSGHHVIAHEVVHMKESHSMKRELIQKLIFAHAPKLRWSEAYRMRNRAEEKQAELFPLLDFGSNVFDEFVNMQIKNCSKLNIKMLGVPSDKWNNSNPLAMHPQCTELLPYIVKIKDLEKKGATPLIRRLDPSDLNVFEKD